MKPFEFTGDQPKVFIRKLFKLFNQWHDLLRQYEEMMSADKDLPYWHTERTNTGLLAAAAVKLCYVAIEEYSAERGTRVKKRAGRADLWICDDEGRGYDFEVKQYWASLHTPKITGIKRELNRAKIDVSNLRYPSKNRIALVFVIPRFLTSNKFDVDEFRETILDTKRIGCSFSALHLCPKQIFEECRSLEDSKYYYYPGIAAIGQYVKS